MSAVNNDVENDGINDLVEEYFKQSLALKIKQINKTKEL